MIKPTATDIVRESVQSQERTKARPKQEGERTQFDQVLKERAQQQQPQLMRPTVTQQAADEGGRRIKREEDRGREQEKDRDKHEEREGKRAGEGDRKTDAKTAEQRVVSKQQLSDEGGGGRRQGGSGGGHGGFEGRRRSAVMHEHSESSRQGPAMLKNTFMRRMAAAMRQPSAALSQRILNLIVTQVKILANSDQEKEIRIELNERIFKGLKLRVVTKSKGRVAVHFTTADSSARQVFEDNKATIVKALARKGIEVAEFTVA